MEDNLNDKLKEINEEDFILVIFIILFIIRIYSNNVERDYRLYNNERDRKKYHDINNFTYVIAVIISIYYFYIHWKNDNKWYGFITEGLSLIGLFAIIYYEITSDD